MVCLFDSLSLIAARAAIYLARSPPCRSELHRPAIRQTLFANAAADHSRGGTQVRCYPWFEAIPNAALFRSLAYLW